MSNSIFSKLEKQLFFVLDNILVGSNTKYKNELESLKLEIEKYNSDKKMTLNTFEEEKKEINKFINLLS